MPQYLKQLVIMTVTTKHEHKDPELTRLTSVVSGLLTVAHIINEETWKSFSSLPFVFLIHPFRDQSTTWSKAPRQWT